MSVRFSDFIFDSDRRELTRLGEPRPLSTKAFILLEHLVATAPRAISKEDLYRHVWGESFVEEANLPNLISEIRAALGENRKSARFIRTIHGFGYAFSGEFERVIDSVATNNLSGPLYCLRWRREEFALSAGENVVGRGEEADVVIASGAISRRHARIIVSSDGVLIEDLGSKNGTFVNDLPVTEPVSLSDGQEVRLGVVSLTFHMVDRGSSTITAMSS